MGYIKEKKRDLLDEINWWGAQEEQHGLSRDEMTFRDIARQDFKRVV